MATTDSNSESAKKWRLSGKANRPQWISKKNKQTKQNKVDSVDAGLHYKNETGQLRGRVVISARMFFGLFMSFLSFFLLYFCPFCHYLNRIVDKRGE